MPGTSGEELGLYTQHYDGYRYDPVFAANVRSFIQGKLMPLRGSPARILDVGCGAGEFLTAAKDAGYDVQGIDISEAAVSMCVKRGVTARVANYITDEIQGDLDVITMWDVLEHLPNPSGFLARTSELLKDGGLFVAKIPYFAALSVQLATKAPKLRGALLGAPDHVQFYSEQSLQKLLGRYGFHVVSFEYGGGMRQANAKGSLAQNMKRRIARSMKSLSGDGNIYLIARSGARQGALAG